MLDFITSISPPTFRAPSSTVASQLIAASLAAAPIDVGDILKYLPSGLTLPHRLTVASIPGHQFVCDRGGVMVALYETRCNGISCPSWDRELDLHPFCRHILLYQAETLVTTPPTNRQNHLLRPHQRRTNAVQHELSRSNGERFLGRAGTPSSTVINGSVFSVPPPCVYCVGESNNTLPCLPQNPKCSVSFTKKGILIQVQRKMIDVRQHTQFNDWYNFTLPRVSSGSFTTFLLLFHTPGLVCTTYWTKGKRSPATTTAGDWGRVVPSAKYSCQENMSARFS